MPPSTTPSPSSPCTASPSSSRWRTYGARRRRGGQEPPEMVVALFASLLALQQPAPAAEGQGASTQEEKPAPVPESDRPKADEHGVTFGKEHAAPGEHENL